MDISEEEIDIGVQDEEKCVNEIVKAVLILDHSKKPFKQTDVTKFLSQKPSRKQWSSALKESKVRLKEMGLTLLQCQNTSAKSFILVSNIFPLPSMYRHADESEVADRTLLILVLAFIFMRQVPVTEVDVFNHLEDLKICSEQNTVHEYFGDVKKKVLKDFVNQLYLEKIMNKDSDTFELKWGERACAEVTKQSILKFVCEIGYEGTIQPKHLRSHYQAALDEEQTESCENFEVMEIQE